MSDGKRHKQSSAKNMSRTSSLQIVDSIIESFDEEIDKDKIDALISKFVNINHSVQGYMLKKFQKKRV
jgi:hypothetical protein